MKVLTATDVARGFSDVLDAAEHGEPVTITRGGRAVARLVPADDTNGTAVADFLDAWAGTLDNETAEQIYAVREESRELPVRDPWVD